MAQISMSFSRLRFGRRDYGSDPSADDIFPNDDVQGETMPAGNPRGAPDDDNVVPFPLPPDRDSGATALQLIYQAAEVLTGMEDRARETEARARSLCQSAAERLREANQRIEAAERERGEVIRDAGSRLDEASEALTHAQTRIEAAEARALAAEIRAQTAEAEVMQARRVLARVEEAIRSRLLGEGIAPPAAYGAVA
jgi:hypothetical protein